MRKFIAILGATLLTASCGGVAVKGAGEQRMPVAGIVVFGDSGVDIGTYADATGDPQNPGKFTVNPGTLWVENVAAHYGLTLTPYRSLTLDKDASSGASTEVGKARVLGGNGYAEGGARVFHHPMQSGVGNNDIVLSVTQQLDIHLSKNNGKFAPNQLVVMAGGGNDIYAQFASLCWQLDNNGDGGKTTAEAASAAMRKAASDQLANIRKAKDAGAGVIMVTLVRPWGLKPPNLSPSYTACKQAVSAAQVDAWAEQFNQQIRDGLRGVAGVLIFSTYDLYRAVFANPQAYGLVNVTDLACNNTKPTKSAAFCTRATMVAPDADKTYMWSDSSHLTPGMNKLMSDQAIAELDAVIRRAPY